MTKLPAVFYTRPAIHALVILASLLADMSVAEPIYKSTNAQGEVVFSDEPPSDAVEVEQIVVQPAPTETEHRESLERTRRMESMADELGTARQSRSAPPPAPGITPSDEAQPTETDVDSDYLREQRRRQAIVREQRPHVEHRAPATAIPHAGGGGRR